MELQSELVRCSNHLAKSVEFVVLAKVFLNCNKGNKGVCLWIIHKIFMFTT